MPSAATLSAGECLYEDERLFVLYKPSGLLVHRGWGRDDCALVDFARERTREGAAHPIQRLDRGASGPVLFARDAESAKWLSELAQQGHCRKDYLALVRGDIASMLDIDYPISRREDGPRVEARTLVTRIATAPTEPRHCSLVLATPLTGRLHQIRRHLRHANYPLYGDVRYGRGELNRAFAENYALTRLALHAYRWSMSDPETGKSLGGIVPLPPELTSAFSAMGFVLGDIEQTLAQVFAEVPNRDAVGDTS